MAQRRTGLTSQGGSGSTDSTSSSREEEEAEEESVSTQSGGSSRQREGFVSASGQEATGSTTDTTDQDSTSTDSSSSDTSSSSGGGGTQTVSTGGLTEAGSQPSGGRQTRQTGTVEVPEQETQTGPTVRTGQTTEEAAAREQFLSDNPEFSEEDIADVRREGDSFAVEFTNQGKQQYVDTNFMAGPTSGPAPQGARQLQSRSGQDATIVFDQGLESGEGEIGQQAKILEENVLAANEGLDASDVTIGFDQASGSFTVDLTEQGQKDFQRQEQQRVNDAIDDITGAGARQPDNAVDTVPRAESIGGDATTDFDRELQTGEQTERVRSDVERQLASEGVDLDRVDINVDRTVDGFKVGVTGSEDEQFGDIPITIPSASDERGTFSRVGGDALGTIAPWGVGPATDDLALLAADEAGVGGRRMEDVLGGASDRFQQVVEENAETGGDLVLSAALPQSLTLKQRTQLVNLFTESDVTVEGFNVSESLEQQSEGFFVGGARMADAPGVAAGVKEAGELGVYSTQEVSKGRGGEVYSDLGQEIDRTVAGVKQQFKDNPSRLGGQAAGSLAGSVLFMGGAARVSGAAGKASRYAIQPGEELAWGTVSRVAGKTSRGTRLMNKLPNNKIDNEELAIYGALKGKEFAGGKARAAGGKFKSAAARARDRAPSSAEIRTKLEPSSTRFIVDERTGDLVPTRTFRPGLVDPKSVEVGTRQAGVESDTGDFDGGDWEPPGDFEPSSGSSSGSNVLSGGVEVDAGNGMKSILRLEQEQRRRPSQRMESPTDMEVDVEAVRPDLEAEAKSDFGMPAEIDIPSESVAAAQDFGFEQRFEDIYGAELGVEQTGLERMGFEQEFGAEFEQRFEFEQEYEQEFEQELEFEQEYEFEQELEFEYEQELELEGDQKADRLGNLRLPGFELNPFEKQYEARVGEIDEFVLGGDL